jgi:glycine oxidase
VTVTIVGAGVIGCAIAYELTVRGATVRVIDGRGVGRGATQASAGILAPHIEAHAGALLDLTLESLGIFDAFVSRVQADSPIPVEYQRSGTLQVAADPSEAVRLREVSVRLEGARVRHTLLDADQTRCFEPRLARTVCGGLFVPEHGYVSPDAFTDALADAASRRGAEFESAQVSAIHTSRQRAEVVANGRRIQSDAVIVAAGSWSGALAPAMSEIRPIRGQLLHLRTPRPVAGRVIWGERCYIVPRLDQSVLVGATVEDAGFDERATATGVRGLLEAAVELVPALADATFCEVRVGLRPMTPTELPVMAPASEPRLYYATGHYRNGVLLAPVTAARMASMVMDG